MVSGPVVASGHVARFYESDTSLVDNVADFIGGALHRADAGVVIATPEHRAALADELQGHGLNLAQAEADGRFLAVDAQQTLGRLMRDGAPAFDLVSDVLGTVLDGAGHGGRRVHVFGEMVALLKADGNGRAAIQLEQHWNRLQDSRDFLLFCAYPLGLFNGSEHADELRQVCREHAAIVPAESFSQLQDEIDRGQAIALLQQKALSLEAEIVRREAAEQQLREALQAERVARRSAEDALMVRNQFLSIASHELRTPLAVLSGQAQLAVRRFVRTGDLDPARVSQALEAIKGQADKLTRLIDQLLDVSRLDAGKLALEVSEVDLVPLVQRIVESARPPRDPERLCFSAEQPGPVIRGDALRLEQVVTNLLDNAVKYSPSGEQIEVSVGSDPNGGAEIAVRDHGLGIPRDRREHIFERFYQAHTGAHRSGMGLGLFISREIVELHGGAIRAEFPLDGGTRFVVRLPAHASLSSAGATGSRQSSD
ncbi:MAG: MEDS domain-containing protein [Chloroflexi bacterium]|nr:MEDS domain-containing protein [Chloroflexota bacterium]